MSNLATTGCHAKHFAHELAEPVRFGQHREAGAAEPRADALQQLLERDLNAGTLEVASKPEHAIALSAGLAGNNQRIPRTALETKGFASDRMA